MTYKTEEDTDHGTDGSDDGNWTCEDEPLKGTDGSRIAAYHAGKTTWRCYECGESFKLFSLLRRNYSELSKVIQVPSTYLRYVQSFKKYFK